jgi:hypothetical protein
MTSLQSSWRSLELTFLRAGMRRSWNRRSPSSTPTSTCTTRPAPATGISVEAAPDLTAMINSPSYVPLWNALKHIVRNHSDTGKPNSSTTQQPVSTASTVNSRCGHRPSAFPEQDRPADPRRRIGASRARSTTTALAEHRRHTDWAEFLSSPSLRRMLRRLYGSIGDYRELFRPIGKPRPTPIGTESGPSSNRPAKSDSYSRRRPRHRPRDPLRRHLYHLAAHPQTPTVGKKLPNT